MVYWECTYLKFGPEPGGGGNGEDFPEPSPTRFYDWEYEENKEFFKEWAEIQDQYKTEVLRQLESMYAQV